MYLLDDFIVYKRSTLDGQEELLKYDRSENGNDSAEMTCNGNMDCIGVHDENCDKEGPLVLARKGFMTADSGQNCVYKKKKYTRKKIF